MSYKTLLLLMCATFVSYAQPKNFNDFQNEITPQYPGCTHEANRYICYQNKIAELICVDINKIHKKKALKEKEIKISLSLRNEKDGSLTPLKIKSDNPEAEKAAIMALKKLPLTRAVIRNGEAQTTTLGFVAVFKMTDNGSGYVIVLKNENETNTPYPADLIATNATFPGCEKGTKKQCNDCFITKFQEWLLSRPEIAQFHAETDTKVTISLEFGNNGILKTSTVKSTSVELSNLIKKALKQCPAISPGKTVTGAPVGLYINIPIVVKK